MINLYIGDMHVVPEELEDCQNLIDYALKTAVDNKVDLVTFLGDQTHNHSLVHLAVLNFWRNAFRKFQDAGIEVVALVGNHDKPGVNGSKLHSMEVFEDICTVVSAPVVYRGLLFIPHMDNPEEALRAMTTYPVKVAVCHQSFDGATYGGLKVGDGINSQAAPQETIISGHIHTPQTFGKVVYVGAPRWRTLTDANYDRQILMVEHADGGGCVGIASFSTNEVCRRIRYAKDTPDSPVDSALDPRADWRIDIEGPADWVESRKARFAFPGVKVRTFVTGGAAPKVRESEGVDTSLVKFASTFKPRFGTPVEVLQDMVSKRVVNADLT